MQHNRLFLFIQNNTHLTPEASHIQVMNAHVCS